MHGQPLENILLKLKWIYSEYKKTFQCNANHQKKFEHVWWQGHYPVQTGQGGALYGGTPPCKQTDTHARN